MVKIIQVNVNPLVVGEYDEFLEDKSKKVVLSRLGDEVHIKIATLTGIQNFIFTKDFAKKLGELFIKVSEWWKWDW